MMDRFEVTNRQFKEFVDGGGYVTPEYWNEEFVKDGQPLSWEAAMTEFRDATGQPGPATWTVGTFLDGHRAYPVRGVSWYEAAAYAEFAGKALPTIFHWDRAARLAMAASIIPLSNFGGEGPAEVGSYPGMSRAGIHDMGGNVREWAWNASGDGRYLLGGAWSDPEYTFYSPRVRSAFDRSAVNGFRCVMYEGTDPPPAFLTRNIPLPRRDYSQEQPASDEVFEAYRRQFLYDAADLNAEVEPFDDTSEHWRKEKVTFDAAYDEDRVVTYLFLPKRGTPPYQTVVLFPGADDVQRRSSDNLGRYATLMEFLPMSGRAVIYPIYKGTYERNDGLESTFAREDRVYRSYVIKWVQDLMRTIDYLKTREDIDAERLAYFCYSWGGWMGAIVPAVEPRLKVAVLAQGGLQMARALPEVDPINFVTHVTIPVLMLNGQYDSTFPPEASQVPMFNPLGTPDEDKRRMVFDNLGHDLYPTRQNAMIRETLAWLDTYLGPVN